MRVSYDYRVLEKRCNLAITWRILTLILSGWICIWSLLQIISRGRPTGPFKGKKERKKLPALWATQWKEEGAGVSWIISLVSKLKYIHETWVIHSWQPQTLRQHNVNKGSVLERHTWYDTVLGQKKPDVKRKMMGECVNRGLKTLRSWPSLMWELTDMSSIWIHVVRKCWLWGSTSTYSWTFQWILSDFKLIWHMYERLREIKDYTSQMETGRLCFEVRYKFR